MSTDAWVVSLSAVAANGDVTQLYPDWCSAGVDPASATNGQLIRRPYEGALHSIQIKPDGTNGGTIEIYDINGLELGVDVSSAAAISDTVLDTAITAGKAKLIFTQSFAGTVGSGVVNAPGIYRGFMKGLAARFWNAGPTGACVLNLVVNNGYAKVESRGQA